MKVASLLTVLAASVALVPSASLAQIVDRGSASRIESRFAPPIDLWLDQISYDRGARMRPFFSTEVGAYVVVVRVSSDGELRVMYPSRPHEQKPYELGQFAGDRMPYTGDPALNLYESSGSGFVFAIASYRPFDFREFTQGRVWSTARLATFGRYGDPFQVVSKFVDRILPENADFSLDYEVYEVYSRGTRGDRYSNFGYSSLYDYHNACLTAFGFRYSNYCRAYNGHYYGPIIVHNPTPAPPRTPKIKSVRPPVHDPMLPTIAQDSRPAVGRQRASDAVERAARQRYERMREQLAPRVPERLPVTPMPRIESPSQPRIESPRQPRVESPRQPRVEGRQPERSDPRERQSPRELRSPRSHEGHEELKQELRIVRGLRGDR